jgi:hypothetical protein
MKRLRTNLIAAATVLLAACTREESAKPTTLGYGYFPLEVGTWVEYQVDSIWRDDDFDIHDTISYRLLERIEEAYTDPAGRSARRILRYVKDPTGEWQVRDVWTATRDAFFAEKTEENMRRLKLSFPVREARIWDVNVYNTDPEWLVAARNAHQPWSGNGLSFDSTVTVRNTVPANLVDRRDYEEVYAMGVGMVHKYEVVTNTQITYPPGQPPQVRVRGYWHRMQAVAHGH